MEGPSLFLAAEQLAPFKGQKVVRVFGNSKIGIERLGGKRIIDIFSWGKHLVFQFDTFAVRIHFLMFGSFEASVKGQPVTGDYKKKIREPRLAFTFKNGHLEMYSCSVRFIESAHAKNDYDFTINLMSDTWNPRRAFTSVQRFPKAQIADVLLDQTIFAGLGNIIKNEILLLAKTKPLTTVSRLSTAKQRELIKLAKSFSLQFYAWRKEFALRKNLRIHRKRLCPICGKDLVRAKTGKLQRWSYYCLKDQPN